MVAGEVMIFRKEKVTILVPGPGLTRVTDGSHEYWVKSVDLKPVPEPKTRRTNESS